MAAPIFDFLAGALFWFALGLFSGALLALGVHLAYEAGRRDQDRSWRAAASGRA
jgi:hypothetical protein